MSEVPLFTNTEQSRTQSGEHRPSGLHLVYRCTSLIINKSKPQGTDLAVPRVPKTANFFLFFISLGARVE